MLLTKKGVFNLKELDEKLRSKNAYKNFFERHTGYPKFKSKKNNTQSCRFEIGAISKRNIYTDYKLSLANIKNIKFKCSKKYAEYLQKNKLNISLFKRCFYIFKKILLQY